MVGIFITLSCLPQALNSQVPLPRPGGALSGPFSAFGNLGNFMAQEGFHAAHVVQCVIICHAARTLFSLSLSVGGYQDLALCSIFALLNFELMLDRLYCPSHRSRSLRAGRILTYRGRRLPQHLIPAAREGAMQRGVNRPSPKNAKRNFSSCRSFQTAIVKPPHPSGRSLAAKVQGA